MKKVKKHGLSSTAPNWDNTALQAVRVVGEMLQSTDAFNSKVMGQLQEAMDVDRDDLESLLDRLSDAWDDLKLQIGRGT